MLICFWQQKIREAAGLRGGGGQGGGACWGVGGGRRGIGWSSVFPYHMFENVTYQLIASLVLNNWAQIIISVKNKSQYTNLVIVKYLKNMVIY